MSTTQEPKPQLPNIHPDVYAALMRIDGALAQCPLPLARHRELNQDVRMVMMHIHTIEVDLASRTADDKPTAKT